MFKKLIILLLVIVVIILAVKYFTVKKTPEEQALREIEADLTEIEESLNLDEIKNFDLDEVEF